MNNIILYFHFSTHLLFQSIYTKRSALFLIILINYLYIRVASSEDVKVEKTKYSKQQKSAATIGPFSLLNNK